MEMVNKLLLQFVAAECHVIYLKFLQLFIKPKINHKSDMISMVDIENAIEIR